MAQEPVFTINFPNPQGIQTCSLVSFDLYVTLAFNTCTLLHWLVVGVVQKKVPLFYEYCATLRDMLNTDLEHKINSSIGCCSK